MSEHSDEIIDEVAACLKLGKHTIYRFTVSGSRPALKLGGTWCFHRSDLGKWIASRIGKNVIDGGVAE